MQTDSDSIDNTDRQKTSAARETFDAVSFYGYNFILYNDIFPFKIWSIIYFKKIRCSPPPMSAVANQLIFTVIHFIVVGYLSGRELGPLTATGAFHSHWGVLLVGIHTYNHCEARMHTIYRVYRHR